MLHGRARVHTKYVLSIDSEKMEESQNSNMSLSVLLYYRRYIWVTKEAREQNIWKKKKEF